MHWFPGLFTFAETFRAEAAEELGRIDEDCIISAHDPVVPG